MLIYVKTSLVEILEKLIWNYICSQVKECCLQFLLTCLYRPAPLALGLNTSALEALAGRIAEILMA
jgi:hypothetical protein